MSTDARIGTTLLTYRIESVLGRGGMGVVYVAEDTRLHRRVALKLLSPDLARDDRFRARFLGESEMAAQLDHPNVIPIYDAGEADEVLYIAMRLVEGMDLRVLLRERGRLPLDRALAIGAQVADALGAAHQRGLVHRDVKPANVLLTERADSDRPDHVYLCDFGLTKATSSISGLTGTGQLVGTVDYVSPEQIDGKPVDARSDIYALGCVLYELLAGEPPFHRENELATLWAKMQDGPANLATLRSDVPPAVAALIARTLDRDPGRRPQTAAELATALRGHMAGTRPAAAAGGSSRRSLALAGLAGVAVAAIIGVAVALSQGGGGAHAQAPVRPGTVAVLDSATGAVVDRLAVGGSPGAEVASGGSVWVADTAAPRLWRIDPATLRVQTVPIQAPAVSLAAGPLGSVLVVDRTNAVEQIDATTGRLAQPPVPLGAGSPGSVAASGTQVWAATARGVGTVAGDGFHPRYPATLGASGLVAIPYGGLYVSDGWRTVRRVNPQVGPQVLDTYPLAGPNDAPAAPAAMAANLAGVWAVETAADEVAEIGNDNTYRGSTAVGRAPVAVAASNSAVWTANAGGSVSRLQPLHVDRGAHTVTIGGRPDGIALAGGRVFVSVAGNAVMGVGGELAVDHSGGIEVMRADGSRANWLTPRGSDDVDPDWSPDGRRLVFSHQVSGGAMLMVVNADGSGLRRIHLPVSLTPLDPAWSPDGRLIAFNCSPDPGGICVVRPDGSGLRHLTHLQRYAGRPAWSPDSSLLAIQVEASNNGNEVEYMRSDGAGLHRLSTADVNAGQPAWIGPRTVAYGTNTSSGSLVEQRLGDPGTLTLADRLGQTPTPELSPDGSRIATGGTWAAEADLVLMFADGTGRVTLIGDGNVGAVDWRPTPAPPG